MVNKTLKNNPANRILVTWWDTRDKVLVTEKFVKDELFKNFLKSLFREKRFDKITVNQKLISRYSDITPLIN